MAATATGRPLPPLCWFEGADEDEVGAVEDDDDEFSVVLPLPLGLIVLT